MEIDRFISRIKNKVRNRKCMYVLALEDVGDLGRVGVAGQGKASGGEAELGGANGGSAEHGQVGGGPVVVGTAVAAVGLVGFLWAEVHGHHFGGGSPLHHVDLSGYRWVWMDAV